MSDNLPKLHRLLAQMEKLSASDLHLKLNAPAIFRVNGTIKRSKGNILTKDDIFQLILECINKKQQETLETNGGVDFAEEVEGIGRFRINAFKQRGAYSLVARYVKSEIASLKSLLLPECLNKLSDFQEGLVLVTGVTGSGKSTTIGSIIDLINEKRSCHIITIEDPIELVHTDKKAIINQRELGQDTADFHLALRDALRQDPDVLFIGELRDKITVETAMMAAETGHLVFATIHSATVSQTISRMLDFFPAERHNQVRVMLQYNLKAIISQRLLKGMTNTNPRVPSVEIMFNTPPIKKAIEEKNDAHITELMHEDKEDGMQTFNQSLLDLYKNGFISEEEAISRSPQPEAIKMNLKGIFLSTSS